MKIIDEIEMQKNPQNKQTDKDRGTRGDRTYSERVRAK